MTWYYALGNERQGPIDDAALDRLIAAGTVTPDTLVWRTGMADWQPLAQARPRATHVPAPVIPPPPAAITPAPAAADPSTEPRVGTPVTPGTPAVTPASGTYGGAGSGYASASGTADWTQAASGSPETADQIYARVVSEGRTVAIGETIGRAWQLVMDNVGLMVGGSAALIVCWLLSAIPCVGILVAVFAIPMLLAGVYVLALKVHRRQPAEIGDAFSAFSTSYLPLLLQAIVAGVLTVLAVMPGYLLMFIGNAFAERSNGLSLILTLAGFLLTVPPAVYLGTSWAFSPLLIVDKGLDFWPAMELSRKVVGKQFVGVFGLLFLCGLIVLAGILALCVGVFFALPVALTAVAIAYDDLFGHA